MTQARRIIDQMRTAGVLEIRPDIRAVNSRFHKTRDILQAQGPLQFPWEFNMLGTVLPLPEAIQHASYSMRTTFSTHPILSIVNGALITLPSPSTLRAM